VKCLKINDKWLQLILEGKKSWEIRRTPTNFRGMIALGNTKTKNYEGYATINDRREAFTDEMQIQQVFKSSLVQTVATVIEIDLKTSYIAVVSTNRLQWKRSA
jgi:hypothetical protein